MRTPRGLASLAACASQLWVTTYPSKGQDAGKLITLKLTEAGLQSVATSDSCGPYPSWLTRASDVLYCVDEAWPSQNGTLAALRISADGNFSKLSSGPTLGGPVSTIVYGDGGRGLAVANYAGGGINTFDITNPAGILPLKAQSFPVPADNRTSPQNQARPHEAVLDPTGNFLVFPDLGADLLRVMRVDKKTLQYTELTPHQFARGTGPRHAAFFTSKNKTYLYVLAELANILTGFSVTYNKDQTLSFTQIYNSTTHGDNKPLPAGTAAAEVHLSPDNRFLTVSSRHEKSMQFTLANGTVVPSDPLITYALDADTGALRLVQVAAAGGANPRGYNFNRDGTLLASALQSDGRVVVFERDVATGKIGKAVAEANVAGMPNFVMFA